MATATGIVPENLTEEEAAQLQETEEKTARFLELEREIQNVRNERDKKVQEIIDEYAPKLKPLEEEHRSVGNRLHELAKSVIPRFGKKKTVKLHAGQLSFRSETEKLKVTDEDVALKAIRKRRWAKDCIKYKPSIVLTELKKKLKASGARKDLPGTAWVGGGEEDQFLYVNSNIKVEPNTPSGEGHDDEAGPTEPDLVPDF